MVDYPEREQATCGGCGAHTEDCTCEFAGDDLAENGPLDFLHCEACHRTTTHLPLCDEYGANRVLACAVCRRIARFY
jgi:hypothetical protein